MKFIGVKVFTFHNFTVLLVMVVIVFTPQMTTYFHLKHMKLKHKMTDSRLGPGTRIWEGNSMLKGG